MISETGENSPLVGDFDRDYFHVIEVWSTTTLNSLAYYG